MTQPKITASIHDIKALSGDVWQVLLKPLTSYSFTAGQYTELVIDGFKGLYFTIGSAPSSACVELHIQAGSETSDRLIPYLQQTQTVDLAPAGGKCTLDELPKSTEPLILIASGTGFSQVKAIVEQLLAEQSKRSIYIYWTGIKLDQLYMAHLAESWANQYEHVHTALLVSENSHWEAKHKMLTQSILADHKDISQHQAVACGSPEMVYALLDTLTEHGFSQTNMVSDVFAFSPR